MAVRNTMMAELWSESLRRVKQNLVPGVVLWIVGVSVVILYYSVPQARPGFESVMQWKQDFGYLYSGIATALFGGLIPFLFLHFTRQVPKGMFLSWGLFCVIYWTIRGIEVDALYRLQAWFFGDDAAWFTIVKKVLVDQFVYCPIWSAPLTALCYGWKDAGFSWSAYRNTQTKRSFAFEVASVLLSIWIVWIPATAIIYSLPLALQIPLFNLVLCFFVLLISVLRREENSPRNNRAEDHRRVDL